MFGPGTIRKIFEDKTSGSTILILIATLLSNKHYLLNTVKLVSKSEPWFLLGIVNFTIDYNQFRH